MTYSKIMAIHISDIEQKKIIKSHDYAMKGAIKKKTKKKLIILSYSI